jgi:hypothetical protein
MFVITRQAADREPHDLHCSMVASSERQITHHARQTANPKNSKVRRFPIRRPLDRQVMQVEYHNLNDDKMVVEPRKSGIRSSFLKRQFSRLGPVA